MVARQVGVRLTVGEDAAGEFENSFGGVEQFVLLDFLVSWAWDWSQEGDGDQ